MPTKSGFIEERQGVVLGEASTSLDGVATERSESASDRNGLGASALPVATYTPESPLRNPLRLVREIFADLIRSRGLVWTLFQRDLKAQFRQSYLGYVWLFAPPLVTTAVWLFLNSQKVVAIRDTGLPYPLFVMIGTIIWQGFANALLGPVKAFNLGKPVFMKLKVPPEAFIAAGTAHVLFDFSIYALLLVPIFVFYSVAPPLTLLLIPLVVLAVFLMATAIGLLMVPIGALYTDVAQALPVLLGFLMYLTPVVYPPPETGIAAEFIRWNPITPILMTARSWLTTGSMDYAAEMILWMPFSIVVIIICLVILRVAMPHLVVRMGM